MFHSVYGEAKEGKVSVETIDNAVRNILRIKFRMGLFENPYVDTRRNHNVYADAHLKLQDRLL